MPIYSLLGGSAAPPLASTCILDCPSPIHPAYVIRMHCHPSNEPMFVLGPPRGDREDPRFERAWSWTRPREVSLHCSVIWEARIFLFSIISINHTQRALRGVISLAGGSVRFPGWAVGGGGVRILVRHPPECGERQY